MSERKKMLLKVNCYRVKYGTWHPRQVCLIKVLRRETNVEEIVKVKFASKLTDTLCVSVSIAQECVCNNRKAFGDGRRHVLESEVQGRKQCSIMLRSSVKGCRDQRRAFDCTRKTSHGEVGENTWRGGPSMSDGKVGVGCKLVIDAVGGG